MAASSDGRLELLLTFVPPRKIKSQTCDTCRRSSTSQDFEVSRLCLHPKNNRVSIVARNGFAPEAVSRLLVGACALLRALPSCNLRRTCSRLPLRPRTQSSTFPY